MSPANYKDALESLPWREENEKRRRLAWLRDPKRAKAIKIASRLRFYNLIQYLTRKIGIR